MFIVTTLYEDDGAGVQAVLNFLKPLLAAAVITVIEVKNGSDKTLSEFEKAEIKLAVDAVVTGTGNFLADKLVQPLGTDTITARPDGSIVADKRGGQNENAVPQSEKRRNEVRLRIDRLHRSAVVDADRRKKILDTPTEDVIATGTHKYTGDDGAGRGTIRVQALRRKGDAMRFYGLALAVAAVLIALGDSARAQSFKSVPIDSNKLVVKPADTATNIVGNSFKYVSRLAAGYVDNNAMVRTVNNLFGKKAQGPLVQGGLSPLPDPRSYPSGYYNSPIQPVFPKYSTYGNK